MSMCTITLWGSLGEAGTARSVLPQCFDTQKVLGKCLFSNGMNHFTWASRNEGSPCWETIIHFLGARKVIIHSGLGMPSQIAKPEWWGSQIFLSIKILLHTNTLNRTGTRSLRQAQAEVVGYIHLGILDCLCCCVTTHLRLGNLYRTEIFSWFWRLGGPRPRDWQT